MQGPSASVRLGKEAQLITLPKQMLMYHSPVAAHLFAKSGWYTYPDTLELPDDSPLAFAHICRWMHQDKLAVVPPIAEFSDRNRWQDACTLLCRVFFTARRLEITAVQRLALRELRRMYRILRDLGYCTPITSSTVLAVWEEGGVECELWEEVLKEMCVAFASNMAVFAGYDECFEKIGEFRRAVGEAMSEAIEKLQATVENCKLNQAEGCVCRV